MDIMTAPPGKGDRSTFETLRVIVSEMTHIKWTQRAESAVAMPEGKRIHLRQKDIDRTTHASRRKEGFNFKNAARWSSLTCVPYFYIKNKKVASLRYRMQTSDISCRSDQKPTHDVAIKIYFLSSYFFTLFFLTFSPLSIVPFHSFYFPLSFLIYLS